MKKFKMSFPMIIAGLVTGFTITSNAKSIGSRVVTACFEQVPLINAAGLTLSLPISTKATCAATEAAIINATVTNSYSWLNGPPSVQKNNCQENLTMYCCLQFDVDASAPSIVPNVVPQSGYASAKYKILYDGATPAPTPRVFCRK